MLGEAIIVTRSGHQKLQLLHS